MLRRFASGLAKLRAWHHERDKVRHRSSKWESVRDAHIDRDPQCAACGGTSMLQVHHIVPFHLDPGLELEPSNLITLCMGEFDCHLRLGHGGSFRCYNPRVIEDVTTFRTGDAGTRLKLLREVRKNRLND